MTLKEDIEAHQAALELARSKELVAWALARAIATGATFGQLAALPVWDIIEGLPVAMLVDLATQEPLLTNAKPKRTRLTAGEVEQVRAVLGINDKIAEISRKSGLDHARCNRALRILERRVLARKLEGGRGLWGTV